MKRIRNLQHVVLPAACLWPSIGFSQTDRGDTAWMLTSTALVLFMTLPGLALFYAGLVRSRNVLSVLMQCFAIAASASILWVVAGYSLAFGDGGAAQPWIGGLGQLFLAGLTADSVY